MLTMFISVYLKMFMILTPFFVISAFLSLTQKYTAAERQQTAIKVTLAVIVTCFVFFVFGRYIFALFGITLDAFRIGAGAVLFISAIGLIQGTRIVASTDPDQELAVVPLAIPITVGPGTIGALLVMGASLKGMPDKIVASAALLAAILSVGGLLLVSGRLEKVIGQQGLVILTKLTGLFVSAIAAQIFFTGVKNFLG
ncbi:MarC family protein [Geopsychrobacter electrodiphilus]|uniref:MarC family protein n=1 Tax=Geopsychrobacter electrodiphilus TaxID=225196 RepID=UPI00037D5940|nr:MarC family protein [Geopsychrobacter electrodiphilus]